MENHLSISLPPDLSHILVPIAPGQIISKKDKFNMPAALKYLLELKSELSTPLLSFNISEASAQKIGNY